MENGLACNGNTYRIIHLRTATLKCMPLIYRSRHRAKKNTAKNTKLLNDTVSEHLILVILDADQPEQETDCIIFGIHVYVYRSPDCYTVFISKADTTGYYDPSNKINVKEITKGALRSILSTIPNTGELKKPVRLCLFAKAHPHYLFQGSAINPQKHVLTDAQLVKWWVNALDEIAVECLDGVDVKAKIIIPGADKSQVTKMTTNTICNWTEGTVFSDESTTSTKAPKAVYRIPRFPDDPKTRFLNHLVFELKTKKTTTTEFWTEMEFRQEFRLGSVVSILGVEGHIKPGLQRTNKIGTVTGKLMNTVYKKITERTFEDLEAARTATRLLLEFIHSACVTTVRGTYVSPPTSAKRKAVDSGQINVLSVKSRRSVK